MLVVTVHVVHNRGFTMFKKMFFLFFAIGVCAHDTMQKTEAIRREITEHDNPNLTQVTHPVIYGMVQELAALAGVPMPRYITTYSAKNAFLQVDFMQDQEARIEKSFSNILAYTDLLGDLYICREILTDMSYADIRGIVALAIAEKMTQSHVKITTAILGSIGASIAALYYGIKNPDPKLVMGAFVVPPLIAAQICSNYFRKANDMSARQIIGRDQLVHAIKSLKNIQERYIKENSIIRIATILKMTDFFNCIFYPIRPYTDKERINYLNT